MNRALQTSTLGPTIIQAVLAGTVLPYEERGKSFAQGITQRTFSCTDVKKGYLEYLQLGLALSLLEDRLHLGRLHDVALDLELAAHEQTLSVGLASHKGGEVCVREGEGDCSTITHY